MSAPATPPPNRRRKHRSAAVERDACLLLLGFDLAKPIEWHHQPSLALRPWDEATQDFIPGENDPRFLRPLQKAAHAEETKQLRPQVDKTRRVVKKQARHLAFMTPQDLTPVLKAKVKRPWPKARKIQSRGFAKKR